MKRGALIHDQAAKHITGKGRLPKALKLFKDKFKDLRWNFRRRSGMVQVEKQLAFTKSWSVTQWKNWAECWVRLAVDCLKFSPDRTEVEIIDWKTGKFRGQNSDTYLNQLSLYALGVFKYCPEVKIVRSSLAYLDAGVSFPFAGPVEHSRKQVVELHREGMMLDGGWGMPDT